MKEFTPGERKLKLDRKVISIVEILICCMKCVRHKDFQRKNDQIFGNCLENEKY